MASIALLAQMSDNVYDGISSTTQNNALLLAGFPPGSNWEVFANSNQVPGNQNWSQGYFGVAYYNTVTGEVVIANRGTNSVQNLESDLGLGLQIPITVQADAAAFANQVISDLRDSNKSFSNVIETGHSLGGSEAQAGVAYLVNQEKMSSSEVSGVVFNSPGIGAYSAPTPTSYNVVDLYDQGDAIHLAGGIHLGGTGNMVMLAAGPNTSALAVLAPAAVAAGPGGIFALLSAALYDIVKPAHSINTIIPYLDTDPVGSVIGSYNWTLGSTASALNGAVVNPALPTLSALANGDVAVTDPASGITVTFAPSSIGSQTVAATFSGGSSAMAQTLASLGTISVPLSELGQSLANISGASTVYEYLFRNANNPYFDVAFEPVNSVGLPSSSTQFAITAANPTNSFDYAVPTITQTVVETIDNGVNNSTGSIAVLGASVTTLTGGLAIPGQSDTWIDTNGDLYGFAPASADSGLGTLTISNGVFGAGGNEIVVDNFNLATAQTASGYLGIVLPETLSVNASANAGASGPTSNYVEGSAPSYTLSVNVPSTTAQIITVTLSGAIPSDFEATVGDAIDQLNANGTFNVTLAAGETNVSFGLIDVTADNGSSDIASGANLQLSAALPNPDTLVGGTIQTTPLTFSYVPSGANTDALLTPSDTITGLDIGGVPDTWQYQGDNNNDYIATTAPNNLIFAGDGNDSVVGNTNPNAIYAGRGNNIIIGNNGTDVITAKNGDNEIYAGAQTNVQNAIAQGTFGAATGVQGDYIAVLDGDNTIVGGNANDVIDVGGGHDVVVLGPGTDLVEGGTETTSVASTWTLTGGVLEGVTGYTNGYTNTFLQPYNGNVYQIQGSSFLAGNSNATVLASSGNDLIRLGNGNNYVDLGTGSSGVLGGMGNDTIIAGSGTDTIQGGGGNVYIAGGSGTDSIVGGDGNNTIIGGSGNATIYGSTDFSLTTGLGTQRFLNANLDQNYITGGSGNDVIYGSAGQDTLIAGTGNTSIYGVTGNENIVGGSGNDLLEGGTGNNTITAAGSGTDTLYAIGSSSSTSILYGGGGQDYIVGGSGINTLYAGDGGTAGAATSVFASQSDATATTTIYGGLGVDFLEGGVGSAVIYGGDGGTSAAPTDIIAGSGNSTLYGGLGTDLVQGGSGTDVLYAGDGGTASAPTTVISGSGVDTLVGGAGPTILQDVLSGQDLLVSGTANDSMIGIGNDTLVAGSGNDALNSNGGSVNFEFNAGFGNDTIYANGGTENLLLGSGLLTSDLTGSVSFDSSGNSYLDLTGDGGSIAVENALTGALASAVYVDPSSIPLPTLLTDVFGGDQTIASGHGANLIVNLANGESITPGLGDTISSWGNNVTIGGASSGDTIYSTGTSALITSGSFDHIVATANNATVNGGISGGDAITLSGGNSIATVGSSVGSNSTTITVSGLNDTVVAGSGTAPADITVNDASAVIQVASGAGSTSVVASVSYTAPTNVSLLTLTGTASISATGNAGADVLTAAAGIDTLIAGTGVATLIGGTGDTTFVVNSASDVVQDTSTTTNNLVQSSVSFVLPANVNSLTLTGTRALTGTANNGNDTLTSNSGVDTLIGGTGNDTFILNNPNDVVQDTAGTATIIYSGAANYTLPANVNTLTLLGSAAIHATGNAANDLITANTGVDTLSAGNGADTLISGLGTAVQSLVGGTGNDLFVVNFTGDIVTVGSTHGSDTINSSVSFSAAANVANLMLIGTANISAIGNSLANVLTANSGADTLTAGVGVATLIGGSGNDLFVVNTASDVVQDSSTTSNDTISSAVSYSLPTNVNTLLLTGSASVTGWANDGNDTLIANNGVDTLIGGAGNDTFVIGVAGDIVQDTSASATNTIDSSVNYSLPTNVSVLILTGTAALHATGNAANDLLVGNSGADTLSAGIGTDTLISGVGATIESLVGGTGTDLFVVNYAADIVTVGATHGADTIQSSVSYTLPTNVNVLTLTGTANLMGAAASGNNAIIGNTGNDTLRAGSGSDSLIAGSGVDTLIGGAGADTFVINSAADVLQSISSAAGNTVVSSVSYSMATNISVLRLTGTANLAATGNAAANTIYANSGADTLTAGTGIANLIGGLGADLFVVNNAIDSVNETNAKSAQDTIQSSVSFTLPNAVNVLLLTGSGNLTGTGNTGPDSIVGNAGLDVLVAGAGTDTLVAGAGIATLVGGASNDTFVINSISDLVQDSISGNHNTLISSVSVTLVTNVNTLQFSGSANLIGTANSANDLLEGNAGADTLKAGSGNDTLVAGSGVDTLIGGTGTTTFIVNNSGDVVQSASTSSQNVVISSATYVLPTNINSLTLTGIANISGSGNAAADTLTAGAGQDTLIAGSGVATLVGGTGNDTFVVNSVSDVVKNTSTTTSNIVSASVNYVLPTNVNTLIFTGTSALKGTANSGNDTLTSNSGIDTLVGGSGNDTFVINNSGVIVQDTVTGASNTAQSSVNYTLASNVNTLILTGSANLAGTANGGSDTLIANSGADTLNGGAGSDTFVINGVADVVKDTVSTTSNTIVSSVSYTSPINVNALTLSGTAALLAVGNVANDLITANSGSDTLIAGGASSTLVGGTGNDLFVVASSGTYVNDSSTTSSDTIQSSASYSLAANVNTLQLTGTTSLTGTANSGNDTLISNSGVDTLVGGSGPDLFIVNNAADVIQNATSNDTIESSVNYVLPANVNNLILIGSANIAATGNANADILTAGAGADTLVSGIGLSTLFGGSGNDIFVVNNAMDVVQNSSTTVSDTIQSSVNFSLPTNVDSLTLTGSANLTATGNADANNVFTANGGNDLLIGSAYANTINGGTGSDTIDAGPESNLIYTGNGGTAAQPTYVHGNATGTNVTTQSTIYGGGGTDLIYGGPGSDVIYAGSGTASIYSGTGFDSLYGSSGDLLIDSLSGYSLLVAGAGPETLGGVALDTLVAGTGADFLYNALLSNYSTTFEFNSGFGHDTIGYGPDSSYGGQSLLDNILIGTGIVPANLSITVQAGSSGNEYQDLQLIMTDGAESIDIKGGLFPGTIGTINFADTGTETLTQLMTLDGPTGTVTIPWLSYNFVVSDGNAQTINADINNEGVFAYGSNDSITAVSVSSVLDTYGNNDTLAGAQVLAQGSGDLINLTPTGTVTVEGANTTVNGGSNDGFYIYQSSTVVQASAGTTHSTVFSTVGYTLPTNVQALILTGNSLVGASNAQGGVLTAEGDNDLLIGGTGSDTLTAAGIADTLIGGAGAEIYVLHSSTDTVQFGTGSASLNAVQAYFNYTLGGGADTLSQYANSAVAAGNNNSDLLVAYGTSDTLVAGPGNDTLTDNGGNATLIGGAGNDIFNAGGTDDVVDTSTTAINILNAYGSFSLPTNVNTLNMSGPGVGTANGGNDSMTANDSSETLIGGTGNDTLVADAGYDTLIAGSGNTVLEDLTSPAYPNTFLFNTGIGQDQVINAQHGDVIQFGPGISQSSLTFTALPGSGGALPSLLITGAGGAVTVQGGLTPGAISSVDFTGGSNYTVQQLLDPSGRVTVPGAGGNLILTSSNGDSLTGGSGQDTVLAWGNNDTLNAGTGGTFIGAIGTGDRVTGGSGTDSLVAYGANNTLIGGAGNENFVISDPTTVVVVTAGIGHDTVYSSVSYTVPANVTVLTLTGTQGLTATANSGNDLITGNAGPDTFNDGGGADTFVGGTGTDWFNVNNSADIVQVSFGGANDVINSSVSYTLPANVTSLYLQGPSLVGTGNSQSDQITSYGSNDTLVSGTGAGGQISVGSNSIIVINNSSDNITFVDTNDTIESSSSATMSGGSYSSNNTNYWNVLGSANVTADYAGDAGSIQITGNAGNDTLIGGGGSVSNILIAGSGIDTLIGGAGNQNTFDVNNTADVVIAVASGSNIIIPTVNYTLPTNGSEMLLHSTDLVATGNSQAGGLLVAYGLDTLVAGSGAERLQSGTGHGANTLVAGTGNDAITAYAGDTLVFNAGFGNSESSVAPGGSTALTVDFGPGLSGSNLTATAVIDSTGQAALAISNGTTAATLDGALSNHSYQYNFNGAGNLSLAQFLAQVHVTTSSVTGANGHAILEGTASTAVTGGTGNDTIYAAATGDTITGGTGNQVLVAVGTNDSIVGGSSSDTLSGLGTNDTLVGGSVADTLVGGTGASVAFIINNTGDVIQLQASPGSDTVDSSVAYSLPANVNTLILTGAAALKGTANNGADTLISNTALDTLVGGSGNDLFVVGNSSDVIQDTSTSATNTAQSSVSFSLATHVNTLILTGTAALTGTGNTAADTLTSNSGVDTLIGGTGNDLFILNNASDVVQDTTTSTSNMVQASFSYILPTNVNSLILTGSAAVTGTANSGTDTLTSNTGLDTLVGSSGNDTFVINNSNDLIQDTSTTATNSVQSSVSYSLATNVNTLTLTGTSALTGTANSGTDTLTSNTGIDTLVGGSANDTFVVNNSNDVIQDTFTATTNTAKSAVSYSLATNVNTLILTGSANLVGTANSGNDSLTGNAGTDTLKGGSGVDTLIAGTGIDTLIGGAGNTTFVINATGDVVQDTVTTTSNTLRSSVTYVLPTNVNALVLTGTLALTGTANASNDTLTSNTAIDTLVGGAGNDVFVISNASDVVQDTSATTSNVIQSTASFSLPTNVNALVFTGSTALHGTANAGNDSLVANTGADTLSAGNGSDTLVSSATGTAVDSLVGGTGNDLFVVNYVGDIVTVGATHGNDTIQSSVSYTASANVANLTLTGTSALSGTGSSLAGRVTANSGADTLTAGSGADTLIGGSGNDTFVINSASDVVQDTVTTTSNVLSSSVSYALPTNVNRLILTGTAALVGTANSANDTLTANTGADTLISGTGVNSLVGGTGANLFIVNNVSDIINVGASHGVDTIQSSVSFTASANVANLTLTGTAALMGTGNSLAGTLKANTGNDTLVAGSGADTLVGGTGTDVFVVNSASDVVSLATSGTSDTIQSSAATYTLPTNVQYLMLTGTAALAGTGNTLLDLITGNTGNDTLTGGTGIAALEGGKTAGSDQIKATGNQAALIAGGGSSTLTGGAFKDFYAAGKVSDSITTGATSNVIAVNKGDGATALQPTTSATNVLSLGAGIDTESLFFTKTGNNLILTDGVSGDSITFTNWYVGTADQDYNTLQVVEIASANYNSGGSDGLRNKALEDFNFKSLVAAYNTAGSPANWALSTAMPSAQLASSSTADYGGDLAYYFGLNGNLTGVDLSAVQSTLTNASFGTAAQTIDSFSSISGGGGLHLLTVKQGSGITDSIVSPQSTDATATVVVTASDASTEPATDAVTVPATASTPTATKTLATAAVTRVPVSSEPLASTIPSGSTEAGPMARILTPRRGIERRIQDPASSASSAVTASAILAAVTSLQSRRSIEPLRRTAIGTSVTQSYVDPINVAWLRMHSALDETSEVRMGAEATTEHEEVGTEALLGSVPPSRIRRLITDPDLQSPLARQRAM